MLKKGLVQVYTGNGKGKTTAAMGLALRAVGSGMKVCMIQFMKGRVNYGELEAAKHLPGFDIVQFGRPEFVDKNNPLPIDIEEAKKGLKYAEDIIEKGNYDIVILDEVNVAVDFNLLSKEDVLKVIEKKGENTELILTGRYAPKEFIERADLVTEMKEIKHPYQKGIQARKGIEF